MIIQRKSDKIMFFVTILLCGAFGLWMEYLVKLNIEADNQVIIASKDAIHKIKASEEEVAKRSDEIKHNIKLIVESEARTKAFLEESAKIKHEIEDIRKSQMVDIIIKKHKVKKDLAKKIVNLSFKYQKDIFPRASDLIAIISIESNFNLTVAEKLKVDPGTGLFQQRLAMWKKELPHICGNLDIEKQFQCGSEILYIKYNETKTKHGAVSAYNQGIGNYYKNGISNVGYVEKYKAAVKKFKI